MAKTLTRTVYVDGVAYGPASAIPEDVAKRITNPKVWADADAPAPAPAGVVPAASARPAGEPPSDSWTVKELKAFAKDHDVALGDSRAKEQILAVLAEAGHGVAPQGDGDEDGQEGAESDDDGDPAEAEDAGADQSPEGDES